MRLSWAKSPRFSGVLNGVFIGVGVIFLIWGATDIAFPIMERMYAAVFGLMRIIVGIVSLSVGISVEAVQWAKIVAKIEKEFGKEPNPLQSGKIVAKIEKELVKEPSPDVPAKPANQPATNQQAVNQPSSETTQNQTNPTNP